MEEKDVRAVRSWPTAFDAAMVHLAQRDTSLAVISRATLAEIESFKKRMGWKLSMGVLVRNRLQL